jgi:hypothetical protein
MSNTSPSSDSISSSLPVLSVLYNSKIGTLFFTYEETSVRILFVPLPLAGTELQKITIGIDLEHNPLQIEFNSSEERLVEKDLAYAIWNKLSVDEGWVAKKEAEAESQYVNDIDYLDGDYHYFTARGFSHTQLTGESGAIDFYYYPKDNSRSAVVYTQLRPSSPDKTYIKVNTSSNSSFPITYTISYMRTKYPLGLARKIWKDLTETGYLPTSTNKQSPQSPSPNKRTLRKPWYANRSIDDGDGTENLSIPYALRA